MGRPDLDRQHAGHQSRCGRHRPGVDCFLPLGAGVFSVDAVRRPCGVATTGPRSPSLGEARRARQPRHGDVSGPRLRGRQNHQRREHGRDCGDDAALLGAARQSAVVRGALKAATCRRDHLAVRPDRADHAGTASRAHACVLVLLPFWLAGPMSAISFSNAPLILYAGTAASIGAPFFWMTGVKQLGAARASLFMNLLPVLVAVAAWALLDEQLYLYHAVGAATTLLGVAVALRQSPSRQ